MIIQRALYAPDNAPDFNVESEFCYWVTALLDMPICFALVGLSVNFFLQIYENMMTIETFGKHGMTQRRYPLVGIPNKHKLF